MDGTYLTTKDAAAILGVSPSRIRQLIIEGRLKAVKTGRDLLLKTSDVTEFSKLPRKRTGRKNNS